MLQRPATVCVLDPSESVNNQCLREAETRQLPKRETMSVDETFERCTEGALPKQELIFSICQGESESDKQRKR